MNIDITEFYLFNVIDSCAVYNILASPKIYSSSLEAKCYYSFTQFVEYECLIKKQQIKSTSKDKLRLLLQREIANKNFQRHNISIDDLQEIKLLENRKRLGMGELSSIAFAKKTNQAFLTDDKAARSLADEILGKKRTQTTPHLVGFLFYNRLLVDGDLSEIINQHNASIVNKWGNLEQFFRQVYEESMRIRLYKKI